jgi:hypothetical protein
MPKLQIVWLNNTPISDADLPYLKQIPTTVTIYVSGTKLSDAAILQLPNAYDDRVRPPGGKPPLGQGN